MGLLIFVVSFIAYLWALLLDPLLSSNIRLLVTMVKHDPCSVLQNSPAKPCLMPFSTKLCGLPVWPTAPSLCNQREKNESISAGQSLRCPSLGVCFGAAGFRHWGPGQFLALKARETTSDDCSQGRGCHAGSAPWGREGAASPLHPHHQAGIWKLQGILHF